MSMLHLLTSSTKITKVASAATSAGTAINSDAVDMSGFEGVVFLGTIATANAGNFANAAQGDTSGGSFADLAGTAVSPGDDADSFCIEVYRPTDRWVRCEIDRSGTNTATGDIYAFQYGARTVPVTHGSTIDSEQHVSPDEGTA